MSIPQRSRDRPPFILRMPFRLAPGRALPDVKKVMEWDGLRVKLEKEDGFSGALLVHGFADYSAAERLVGALKAALTWAALQEDFSFEAKIEIGNVIYADDPEAVTRNLREGLGIQTEDLVDGLGDGDVPIIYAEGLNIRRTYVGTAIAGVELGEEAVLSSLVEGLELRISERTIEDDRIGAALDLYFSSFFEKTLRGRFLVLVMALEALIIRPVRPPAVVALLQEFCARAADLRESYEPGAPEIIALDALRGELDFRTRSSISGEVRKFAKKTAEFLGEDGQNAVEDAKTIYNTRSHLTHEGFVAQIELASALAKARSLVRAMMIAVLKQPALIRVDGS